MDEIPFPVTERPDYFCEPLISGGCLREEPVSYESGK